MYATQKPALNSVYLAHAGKKGMKWGVRKAKPQGNIRKGIAKSSAGTKAKIGLAAVAATIALGRVLPVSAPITIAAGAGVAAALLAREGRRPLRRK